MNLLNRLICKLFGHKNTSSKEIKGVEGYRVFYSRSNHWNCMRCGECTQRLYFSNSPKETNKEKEK